MLQNTQTNTLNCLGRCISCQNEKYSTVKISEFLELKGIINRKFNPLQSNNALDWKHMTIWHCLIYYMDANLGQLSKSVPLEARDAQDVDKVVSLTHWPLLRLGNTPGNHFC